MSHIPIPTSQHLHHDSTHQRQATAPLFHTPSPKMAGHSILSAPKANSKAGQMTSSSTSQQQTSTRTTAPVRKHNSNYAGLPNPARFTKFHQFRKIPVEIRLQIWRCTMRQRIIRAEYQNIMSELVHADMRLARYCLDAGVVPVALAVCTESRYEAKKFYTLIKAMLPVKPLEKDGERLPPGIEPPNMPNWLETQIWVNVEVDVFFFVNFPSTNEFLGYFRRISKPSVGGLPLTSPIKHIALVGKDTQRFRTSGRTDLFYSLCMEHTQLKTINIVMDNSKYREDPKPESYSLWKLNPLPEDSQRGGGQHGSRDVREHVIDIFRGFWEGKKTVKYHQKWITWKQANKDWKPPKVHLKSISKLPRPPLAHKKKKGVVVEEIESESDKSRCKPSA